MTAGDGLGSSAPPSWFLASVADALDACDEGDVTALLLLDLPDAPAGEVEPVPSPVEALGTRAWPGAQQAVASVWAALVYPHAQVLPSPMNPAHAIRIARVALGAGTAVDHLAVAVLLWWRELINTMTGSRIARRLARPASVALQWLSLAGRAGAVLEWLILLPGRSAQLTLTHVVLRAGGSRPILGRPAFSQPLRWTPLPAIGVAAASKAVALTVVWLSGVTALLAYQAPGSWLALAPTLPIGVAQDESTLVLASALVENSGPLGLGLWIPFSLLAVSIPAYSDLLALREACRGGGWPLQATRVLIAPMQLLSFLVWPLARIFSLVGLGTIFGSGLVGVATGLAATQFIVRVLA